jgi:hypothetical protein
MPELDLATVTAADGCDLLAAAETSPTTSRQAFRKLSITSRIELARIVIEQAADGASQRN